MQIYKWIWFNILIILAAISCNTSEITIPDDLSIEIIFGGDIELGDSYHLHSDGGQDSCIFKTNGYDHSFKRIRPLLVSSDVLISNLETPLATDYPNNKLKKTKRYLHWCQPEKAAKILKGIGFDFLSLANNHILDQGQEGLINTLELLDSSGIFDFGAGLNVKTAGVPAIIDSSGNNGGIYLIGAFEYVDIYDHMYNFYAGDNKPGVWKLDENLIKTQINEIRENDPRAFIILFPHWGGNYQWADDNQKILGAKLLDAGIDLIIGHGAHTLQEIENKNGKFIFYNLGNLVMNSPGRYRSSRALPYSFIVKINLKRVQGKYQIEPRIYPIVSDNRITNYQPQLASLRDMQIIKKTLEERSINLVGSLNVMQDEIGYYLNIK